MTATVLLHFREVPLPIQLIHRGSIIATAVDYGQGVVGAVHKPPLWTGFRGERMGWLLFDINLKMVTLVNFILSTLAHIFF